MRVANYDKYKVTNDPDKKEFEDAEKLDSDEEKVRPMAEHVPLYRSYGITRKVNILLEKITNKILDLLIIYIYIIPIIFLLFVSFILIFLTKWFGKLLFGTSALVLILWIPVRYIAKRASFVSKLKKYCRTNHYSLEFKRGFFAALKYQKNGYDIKVNTGKKVWYVKYLASVRYNRYITFVSPEKIIVSKGITKNRLKEALGKNQPRRVEKDFSFLGNFGGGKKAVVINPVPREIWFMENDANRRKREIGTGESIFDYTVFSGSGFIEALRREDIDY